MKKAFSLVELMIVVAVIGILAALTIPKVQDYSRQAREATAKENLMTMRSAIELYASQHNGVPPGYPDNNAAANPTNMAMTLQLTMTTNASGIWGERGNPGYIYGPYLPKFPPNPFNGARTAYVVPNGRAFPALTGQYGYVYQPATKTIKLDAVGTDSKGVRYSDY
jgi:prepilin-type N-terminal cleavage/methylation domain-containing protein